MGNRLKIAIPFAVALTLAVLFVVLLLDQAARPGPEGSSGDNVAEGQEDAPPLGEASPTPEPDRTILGSPTAQDPYRRPARPRSAGKFSRWNLGKLPRGWDPEIASRLHELLEALEYDHLSSGEVTTRVREAYEELREYLASLGPEAIPTLSTILHAEPDFVGRRRIFEAIGSLGPQSEEATWALRDFYFARRDVDGAHSELVNLVRAMGHLKNDTSYELLRDLGTSEAHREYRDNFIVALGDHPRAEESVDVFVDAMTGDDVFRVRNHAAQALGKVRSPETLPELYDAYSREPIWYARQTILGSIGKVGDATALPFLETQAREAKESGVRLSAASAIRRIVQATGDPRGRMILEDLAESEPDPKVRSYVRRWALE